MTAAAFAFNPAQARAPRGSSIGGRWIDVAGGVLAGLEAHNLLDDAQIEDIPQVSYEPVGHDYDQDPITGEIIENPVYIEMGDENDPFFSVGHDTRNEDLQQETTEAMYAYMTDTTHHFIMEGLRDGTIKSDGGTRVTGPEDASRGWEAGHQTYYEVGAGVTVEPVGWNMPPEVSIRGDGVGVVAALDAGMKNNSVRQTVRLYRGIAVDSYDDFKVGDTWREMAYTSTTNDPMIAGEFAKLRAGWPSALDDNELRDTVRDGTPMLLEIIVPQGTNFMAGAPSVHEVILERGLDFEVVKTSHEGQLVTLLATPTNVGDVSA